jgi:hypothetical protein
MNQNKENNHYPCHVCGSTEIELIKGQYSRYCKCQHCGLSGPAIGNYEYQNAWWQWNVYNGMPNNKGFDYAWWSPESEAQKRTRENRKK